MQAIFHGFVVIDHIRHVVDGVNDVFRQVVTRCRFTGKNKHARRVILIRIGFQRLVRGDNVQQVQMLTFIFVETFNLNVENRIGIDGEAQGALNFIG